MPAVETTISAIQPRLSSTNGTEVLAVDVTINGTTGSGSLALTVALAPLTTELAEHDSEINANTSAIAVNSSGISVLNAEVASNSTGINTLNGEVAANTSGIASNTTAITTLNAEVAANSSSISGINSTIGAIETSITGINTTLSTHSTEIAANTSGISTLNTDLSTFVPEIQRYASGAPTRLFLDPISGLPIGPAPTLAIQLPPGVLSFGCIGDSITRNQAGATGQNASTIGNTVIFTTRAWARRAAMLMNRQIWIDPLAVEGYSGYRTDQIFGAMLPPTYQIPWSANNATALPYGVLARKPACCFVLAGTNDIGSIVALGTSMQDFLQGTRAIWSRLLQAGILPICLSLLPRNAPAINAALVPTWNAALATLALQWGVPFIDIYTTCAASIGGGWKTGYDWYNGAEDPAGLHPGSLGCQAIAQAIAAQLPYYIGIGRGSPTIYSSTNHITPNTVQQVAAAVPATPGTGFNVGDVIIPTNANLLSAWTPCLLQVTSVGANGAITGLAVIEGGIYPSGSTTTGVGIQVVWADGCPFIAGAGTGATFNFTMANGLFDPLRKGDDFVNFDTGLFPNTTGWTARYDPNAASTVSVSSSDPIAQYGNALEIAVAAPGSGSNYADFWGPGYQTVVPGGKYGFFGRSQFAAGSPQDSVSIGLQGGTIAGAMLWSFNTGGSDNSAYNIAGASDPVGDFYDEIVIPSGITQVRPFIVTYTYPGAGSLTKFAQLGMQRLN